MFDSTDFQKRDDPPSAVRGSAIELDRLHERHFALTPAVASSFAEAAGVCIERRHAPPAAFRVVSDNLAAAPVTVSWPPSSARARAAHANPEDVVKEGAYSVTLAVVEAHMDLFAITQAPKGSGSDYYVGPAGSLVNEDDGELDLEAAFRLEVSGSASEDESGLRYRLSEKVKQLKSGRSDLPALGAVVGFDQLLVLTRKLI
jgi:hypothetical protein